MIQQKKNDHEWKKNCGKKGETWAVHCSFE
jgi:hypothetical protein